MVITILGGTGFVGRHITRKLIDAGHSVYILTRNAARHRELRLISDTHLLSLDIYSADALAQHLNGSNTTAIINLVGILNEQGFDGSGFNRAHVELTGTVIRACRQSTVRRYLHMSSLNAGKGNSHYLISRGKAEQLIRSAAQDGTIEYTVFQPSVIFGEHDSFINRFSQLLSIAPLLPLACPDAQLQPVWVDDVASAFCRSLRHRNTINNSYPLVGPQVYTLYQLVKLIAQAGHHHSWIIPLPGFLARIQALVMDFIPGKPFSSDNYRSLQTDNISSIDGLNQLGIKSTSLTDYLTQSHRQPSHQPRLNQYRQQAGRLAAEWEHVKR